MFKSLHELSKIHYLVSRLTILLCSSCTQRMYRMQSAEEQELAALCTRHNDASLDSEIQENRYSASLPIGITARGDIIYPNTKLSSICCDTASLRAFLTKIGWTLYNLYDIPILVKALEERHFLIQKEKKNAVSIEQEIKALKALLLPDANDYDATFLDFIERYMELADKIRARVWEEISWMLKNSKGVDQQTQTRLRPARILLEKRFEEAKPYIKNQETYCKIFSFLCRDGSKKINLIRLLLKYSTITATHFEIPLNTKDPKSLYAMCSLYDRYSDSQEGLEVIEQLLLSHLYQDSGKLFSELIQEYQYEQAMLLPGLSGLSIQKNTKSKNKSKSKHRSLKPANLGNEEGDTNEQHEEEQKGNILEEGEASTSKINVPFQNQTSIFKIHPRVKKWQWPIEKLEAYFQRPNNISDQKYSRQSGLELEQQKIVHDLYGAHKILEGPDHNDYFSYSPYGKYKQSKSVSAYSSLIVYDTSGNEVLQNDRGFVDIGIEEKEDKSPLIYHLMFRKEQSEQKAAENILRSSSSAAYKSFQEEREGKVSKAEEQEDQVSEDEDTGFTPPKGGKYTISRDRNNDYIVDFFRDHKRHKSLHIYSCKPKKLFP